MNGFPLSLFKNDLARVPAHRTKDPGQTVDVQGVLGPDLLERAKQYFDAVDTRALVRRLPAVAYQNRFTFDQLCKIHYNQVTSMDATVEALFRDNPEYVIVEKIENSMWRWGVGSGVWNEVVDAYNGIRNFSFPVEDFDVLLDYTTGTNPRGSSTETRTYLDGVFGFLLYHKGKHVMTLGFSIMRGRRVLVQQVQLTQKKGNRFLFSLPPNRIEFVLQCFQAAFPRHTLCLADGAEICATNLASYRYGLENVMRRLEKDSSDKLDQEEKEAFESCIAHLTAEVPRLTALYANTGKFVRKGEFKVNDIRHYRLEAQDNYECLDDSAGVPSARRHRSRPGGRGLSRVAQAC